MIVSQEYPSSSSSAIHRAQLDTRTGQASCSCPGWRFPRGGRPRECKHTKDLIARHGTPGGQVAPTAPPRANAPTANAKPMLASAMPEGKTVEDYARGGWVLEEKYDGHRMLVRVAQDTVVAWARPRAGEAAIARVLPRELARDAARLADGLYDGELYLPGGTSSDVPRLDKQDALRLVLFDVVELCGQSAAAFPYRQRREVLAAAAKRLPRGARVAIAAAVPVTAAAVAAIWKRGGEGAILKRADSQYHAGSRSADWIKVKREGAAELVIVGFREEKSGPYSVAQLRTDDGIETSAKVRDEATRRAIAKDPASYLNRRLVVTHKGRMPSGKYRHAIWDHVL